MSGTICTMTNGAASAEFVRSCAKAHREWRQLQDFEEADRGLSDEDFDWDDDDEYEEDDDYCLDVRREWRWANGI